MAVSRKAMTEGIRTAAFPSILNNAPLQSLSQKSKIFASSLYTREPLGCSRTSNYTGAQRHALNRLCEKRKRPVFLRTRVKKP